MAQVSKSLLAYMEKWGGRTGLLVLAKETEKLGIRDIDSMDDEVKEKLLNALTGDWLSTFLTYRRFQMARAELVSIFGLPETSYRIRDARFRAPKSPSMIGRPEP